MQFLTTARIGSLIIAVLAAAAHAQSTVVREPATKPATGAAGATAGQLASVPYDASLPKPIFPSTPREQKEFTVRYIYDYAQSTYTPAVTLPKVPRAQIDRSTPEGAMIAMVSMMDAGDYDGWLQCWDEESRKTFEDAAKSGKGAAYWQKMWQTMVTGKSVVLVYRLEIIGYVVLDARFASAGKTQGGLFPSVFKNVRGKWYATNALAQSVMLGNWQPGVAGVDSKVSPEPLAQLSGPSAQEGEAQQDFIKLHTQRASITKAAR